MVKHIGQKVNDIPIKRKLMILVLLGVLIPTLVLLTVFFRQMQKDFKIREKALVETELSRLQSSIHTSLETVKQLASIYYADKEQAKALSKYSPEQKESLNAIRKIDSQVLSYMSVHPFIRDIHIYVNQPDFFETTYAKELNAEVKSQRWYKDFISQNYNVFLNYDTEDDMSNLYYIRRLNILNYETENLVKIDLSIQWIKDHYFSNYLDSQWGSLYLLNAEGDIVTGNRLSDEKNLSDILEKKHKYLYKSTFPTTSSLAGWSVMISYPRSILAQDFYRQVMFAGTMFFIIFSLSFGLFYWMANSIIRRLEILAAIMNQSKTEGLTLIEQNMGKDEIGETAESYNRLVRHMMELHEYNKQVNRDLQSSYLELQESMEKLEQKDIQIEELVYRDKLTGLLNRNGITSYIDQNIHRTKEDEYSAICFMDMDNFKTINDTYGHDMGDKVLTHLGKRLQEFEQDEKKKIHAGRFGGDEFIIVLEHFYSTEEIEIMIRKIRERLNQNMLIDQIVFPLSCSFGVSYYRIHSKRRHELITLSDIALFKAKDLGRDQIVIFESDMYELLAIKTMQQEEIRKAIEQNQFCLYYQPYYQTKNAEIDGCEALVRWNEDCTLHMNVQEVINHIEEMGLMIEFGKWILREAFQFAKIINKNRDTAFVVSVNISAIQLMSPNFVEDVFEIMKDCNISPSYFSLEMTESILLSSMELSSEKLKRLREAGIAIYLDDFGTGYSSLRYFKELPISTLKIDKSFVDHICSNDYDAQLVDTIIQLAHNKQVRVIAEGIESKEQYELLRKLDCDAIQGYYFSKPVSKERIQELLKLIY